MPEPSRAGATQAQREQVAAELRRLCPTARAIADVTAEMTASQRSALLHAAEHLFITTRILVVDLLTQRLPTHQVAGLLILNAHRATEQSGEGFAVRLLRAGNKSAFVRGLSDEPGLASRGLSSLERTLRALHVREVFLWPRFRSDVQDNMHAVDVRTHPAHPAAACTWLLFDALQTAESTPLVKLQRFTGEQGSSWIGLEHQREMPRRAGA